MNLASQDLIVIIDPQKDFTDPGFAYARRHTIRQITETKQRLEQLLLKTNPDKTIIIYSDYQPNQFGNGFTACLPNTPGHDISIANADSLIKFSKTRYSCFSSESLVPFLKANRINHLLLCGFLTEYCIYATASDALEKNYRVTLVADLLGSADDKQEVMATTIKILTRQGANITLSKIYSPTAS